MLHFFENRKTYAFFRELARNLPEEKRSRFYGDMSRAYHAKQNSQEDNLTTYALTKDEVQSLHDQLAPK